MRSKRAFRPSTPDRLESRLVLSEVGRLPGPAEVRALAPMRQIQPAANRMTVQLEVNFLTGMIPHHRMAIRMSRLALRNSDNPEVRDLARRIIAGQRPEIQQMQRFLAVDGVRDYRPAIARDERGVLLELRGLRGRAFDEAFLTEMIGHHEAAISGEHGMVGAAECFGRAAQPGLRRLCGNIIATQNAEIQEMKGLLGEAGGTPGGGHSG